MNKKSLNYWQLSCIFGTALGVPAIYLGSTLTLLFGTGIALACVFLGNLVIWLFSLAVLSMTIEKKNALENIQDYLGKRAAKIIAFIFVLSFIFWYPIQLDPAARAFAQIFKNNFIEIKYKFVLILGLLTSLLSLGGLKIIKFICVYTFPFLLFYQVYVMGRFGMDYAPYNSTNIQYDIVYGLLLVIFTWLPGAMNIPTFTQHAKSKIDSFLALSIMTIIHLFFQVAAVFTYKSNNLLEISYSGFTFNWLISLIFILFSYFCINLANVFFASAAWEIFFHKKLLNNNEDYQIHTSNQKFAIISMLGTLIFMFFQVFDFMKFIENSLSNFMALLSITLLTAFLLRIVLKHHLGSSEKTISVLCLALAYIAALFQQIRFPANLIKQLGLASWVAALYLIIMFGKETTWSVVTKIKRSRKKQDE